MSDTVIGLALSALIIMGIVLLPLYFMQKSKIKTLTSEQEELNELTAAQKNKIEAYQHLDPIIDAKAEALIIFNEATEASKTTALGAKKHADSVTKAANEYSENQKSKSDSILESSMQRAEKIVELSQTKAGRIVHDAVQKANRAIEVSEGESEEIVLAAKRDRQNAKDYFSKQTAKSDATLEAAKQSADKIVEFAHTEARTIAGGAIEAKSKADQYTRTVKAMRNTIDGYGDEYIIPCHSLLDDLAEDFSHKDAGVELKRARDHSKALIKNGQAAKCDYVEERRKSTAVRFIADAFNGKCDSILSKVKHDNYGKLQQAILDAFDLVNINGEAFRNAVITKIYLEARLDELKWAISTKELQLIEREEQRAIKEQIREEERARKEYEKAIKEAEKEERLLHKAKAEAEKHLAAANAEQRQIYELQLQELEGKLQLAEDKNKRALSMAQQTRMGHVYIISNIGSFGENVYKVGMTRRLEPMDRVKELGDASVPFTFDVHAMINHEDAPKLEKELHKKFSRSRVNQVNHRKEFFNISLIELKQAIVDMGIETHWTMASDAQQYRESVAIRQQSQEESAYTEITV